MAIAQLLPARIKVALSAARNDVRHFARALREERFKGVRPASGSYDALEVRFQPSRPGPATTARRTQEAQTGKVQFADSGVTLTLGPDETILEAGLRNGVDLLYSCTLGGCGACMLQIREGVVTYDDPDAICLTEEEIEDGCCLACVGKPRGLVVLEA